MTDMSNEDCMCIMLIIIAIAQTVQMIIAMRK